MRSSVRYAMAGTALVALLALAVSPFLDEGGRRGVAGAALVALPVQIAAFALLVRVRDDLNVFLAAWLGGTLLRMMIVGAAALVIIRADMPGAVPALLALAGFFFGLLLLEPLFFRLESTTVDA